MDNNANILDVIYGELQTQITTLKRTRIAWKLNATTSLGSLVIFLVTSDTRFLIAQAITTTLLSYALAHRSHSRREKLMARLMSIYARHFESK